MCEAAQLADELQRRGADFILRRGRLEVEQRADVAAHRSLLLDRSSLYIYRPIRHVDGPQRPCRQTAEPVSIAVGDNVTSPACCKRRRGARACYVLAHGAGAGMTHPFMAAVADGPRRARHRDAALPVPLHGARQQAARSAEARACGGARRGRRGARRTAGAAAVRRRQVVRRAHDLAGAGRCAAAGRARPGVPRLSAASGRSKPSRERGEHLFDVHIPMLFLQGTRDALAELDQLEPVCKRSARAHAEAV